MSGFKVEDIERRSDGSLPTFTSLGSYPMIYYTASFDTLCAACASKDDTSDPAVWADVYYEGPPEQCCDCSTEISSAYGDPDAS